MRTFRGHTPCALIALWLAATPAFGQSASSEVFNRNYSNHTGTSLPQVPMPNGHDEIRAADGTACRSSMSGSGSYFDVGVLGSRPEADEDNLGVYARLVVPLGERPRRLDCTHIYQLEVERLKMELEMVRMGLRGGITE